MQVSKESAEVLPAIGAAVYKYSPYGDRQGWIAEVSQETGNVYSLDSGRMVRQTQNITIVFDDDTETTVSEDIAGPWLAAAIRYGMKSIEPEQAAARLKSAKAKAIAARDERQAEAQRQREAVAAYRDRYRDKIPTDAVAVIVAELQRDDSDVMTDYFNVKTVRTVLLAFSSHTKDLFSEMRKAARNFPETAALADAGPEVEHREKWSMGAGYYLKGGNKYSDGWAVKKQRMWRPAGSNDLAEGLPFGEWAIPDAAAEEPKTARKTAPASDDPKTEESATVNGFTISNHVHTKRGFSMFIVETPERVSADAFTHRLNKAKDLRGWYSRAWGSTPAGFAFKSEADARKFAESL
jgi:hypothetical protein